MEKTIMELIWLTEGCSVPLELCQWEWAYGLQNQLDKLFRSRVRSQDEES